MKGAANPRRAELRAHSAALRPLVKAGCYANINEGLTAHYRAETGQADFRTFFAWREAGRPVKKGERGFPIWATPRARKPGEGESLGGDLAALAALSGITPAGPRWFPIAYLFHAGQVEPAQSTTEEIAA